jgi:hypothetical protein
MNLNFAFLHSKHLQVSIAVTNHNLQNTREINTSKAIISAHTGD